MWKPKVWIPIFHNGDHMLKHIIETHNWVSNGTSWLLIPQNQLLLNPHSNKNILSFPPKSHSQILSFSFPINLHPKLNAPRWNLTYTIIHLISGFAVYSEKKTHHCTWDTHSTFFFFFILSRYTFYSDILFLRHAIGQNVLPSSYLISSH